MPQEVSHRTMPRALVRNALTVGKTNLYLRRDDRHAIGDLLLGTVPLPCSLALGLVFLSRAPGLYGRHRLVRLVPPLGLLNIDLHERCISPSLGLNPTRSQWFHGQLCKIIGKRSNVNPGEVFKLIVVVPSALRKVCVTRRVSRSVGDERSREMKVLLERRWR